MNRPTRIPAFRASLGVLAGLLLSTSVACERASPDSTSPPWCTPAQAKLLSLLMPDPQIVNTHQHLMDTRGGLARLKLEAVNRRVGVVSTALVGSSLWTFTLKKGTGFVEHHQNNEFLCQLAGENPGQYSAWVTFDPEDEDIVPRLEAYLTAGALGVKLYVGHGAKTGDGRPFHVCPLDDPKLIPLYDYCQAHRVPICLHINMDKFEMEARRVFDRYPELPVIVPHYALWSRSKRRGRLDRLLTRYPSLLTDNSFGWSYSVAGFKRYDKDTRAMRDFIIKHQDRILFGTDVVITAAKSKSTDALTDFFLAYRASLELAEFDFRDLKGKEYHFKGLALPEAVVRKIYRENWLRLLKRIGRVNQSGPSQPVAVSGG